MVSKKEKESKKMKVILPMNYDALQQFLHTWYGVLIVAIGFCLFLILGFVFGCCSEDAMHLKGKISFAVLTGLSVVLAITCMVCWIMTANSNNPRADTMYSSGKVLQINANWTNDDITGFYYADDYLRVGSSKHKIAKSHWTNKSVTITPTNLTGCAWMTVAKKLSSIHGMKDNVKINIKPDQVTAQANTIHGRQKFICYTDNRKTKKKGYIVLKNHG